jgi:signal transduction histidine kinase
VPVALRVEGGAVPLPPGVDLAAYRVVQEALTNSRKHAAGASARVVLRYGSADVEVLIENDGLGTTGTARTRGGYGLAGMRERVKLYGGTLERPGPARAADTGSRPGCRSGRRDDRAPGHRR